MSAISSDHLVCIEQDCSSFRPISLLKILSKVYESALKSQVNRYLEMNNLFFQGQFGFRTKKTTTLAIDHLARHVLMGFESGLDTFASCLDLTKAFDCVSHAILLKKLSYYNFDQDSIHLLSSYLCDRVQ